MVATAVVETRDRVWSPVLDGLHAEALDCIQTGLAALADLHHGAGAHVALGAYLGFAAVLEPLPSVEIPVDARLAQARELAGLRVVERRDGLDGPGLRQFAAEAAGPLYAIADTFTMAWTPYRGQRHLEHSFLLTVAGGRYTVIDPYHNETQWGVARPGVWRLSAAELDAAVAGGASAMVITAGPRPEPDPAAVLAGNAAELAGARPRIAEYLAAVRAGLASAADSADAVEQLVLDVWLLGRSRLLHAAWLRTVPRLPAPLLAEADAGAQDWLRLASQSYVGMRRVQRGGELPPSVVERLGELLLGDVELSARLAAAAGPAPAVVGRDSAPDGVAGQDGVPNGVAGQDAALDGVREEVITAVRAVLRLDDGTVRTSRALRSLPNFNSFRLVDIVERVESRLGVQLDADDLTAEALHDIDSLARLFARTAARAAP